MLKIGGDWSEVIERIATANNPEVDRVPIVLAGFGRHAQRVTAREILDSELADKVRFLGSACLLGGSDEHRTNIIPYFSRRGVNPPEYQKTLEAAIESAATLAGHRPVVIINTPNTQHVDQIITALEHGCDVYVERPIVTHLDPLPEIVEFAKRQGAILYTGVQRRTERAYRTIRRIILKRHEFTAPIAVRCTLRAGHILTDWRTNVTDAGGGIVIDSGYHLLDFSAWLANDLVSRKM